MFELEVPWKLKVMISIELNIDLTNYGPKNV
jgi:hypothetical protein